jgi:pimeloyl-ACP methyl ester carboxylesterase
METFTSKTLRLHGKTIRYYTNRRKNGKPIIVLHGFMSDATSLIPFAEGLGVDQPMIIPDLPGFGGSDMPNSDQGLRWYVDWLKDFLQALEIEAPAAIVGYSFGAYIAVLYSSLFPKLAGDKLVLLTPVVKISWQVRLYGRGFRFMAFRNQRLAERAYLLQHDMTTRYLWKNRHPGVRTQLMERRRGELEYLNPELVLRLFSEFLEINLLNYAKKLKMPLLIVMASNDNVAASSATRLFASQVKTPIVVMEIHHAGHLLPIEEPQLLASSLRSYFS